jgi:hypothetical protein
MQVLPASLAPAVFTPSFQPCDVRLSASALRLEGARVIEQQAYYKACAPAPVTRISPAAPEPQALAAPTPTKRGKPIAREAS